MFRSFETDCEQLDRLIQPERVHAAVLLGIWLWKRPRQFRLVTVVHKLLYCQLLIRRNRHVQQILILTGKSFPSRYLLNVPESCIWGGLRQRIRRFEQGRSFSRTDGSLLSLFGYGSWQEAATPSSRSKEKRRHRMPEVAIGRWWQMNAVRPFKFDAAIRYGLKNW